MEWNEGDPEKVFSLASEIDEGAFSTVWKGKELKTGRDVAVKKIVYQEALVEELSAEVAFLKQLKSDFVVRYFGAWFHERDNEIWVVMELAELGSLEGVLLVCEKTFNEVEMAGIMARVLLGLEYVHAQGLVHQDIKAKNILLSLSGEVKLADFGVAASISSMNESAGFVSGSPHWMAPEVLMNAGVSEKADVWSLGITMLELTEGQPPYADIPPMNVISLIPERSSPKFHQPQKWSPGIKSFLSDVLEKSPAKRKSAKAMLKHPFVANEVTKALKGQHSVLKRMAEQCYETMQSYDAAMDFGSLESGLVEEASTDESSDEYSVTNSDAESDVVGNALEPGRAKLRPPGARKNMRKKKSSVASIVVDENEMANIKAEEEQARKLLKKKKSSRGTRLRRATRGSKINGRKLSKKTRLVRGTVPARSMAKQSVVVRNRFEINMNDLKGAGGKGGPRSDKAADFLTKLQERKKLAKQRLRMGRI